MKILVIDDEKSILNLIKFNLELEGYEVITAEDGETGLEKFEIYNPELVILDIMLPDMEGYDVLKEIQAEKIETPVMLLTAKSKQNDKILGLQLGADDYITKPFDSKELMLRVKAIIRRLKLTNSLKSSNNIVENKYIKIIKDERRVFVDEVEIQTTYREFDVLLLLCENESRVFTREELLERVWGYDYEGTTRAVDILIKRLREKLNKYSSIIVTIYGVGYKLEV